MATERKEKLIRVLQILESTDKNSPVNAKTITDRLNHDYDLEQVDRRSIYKDIVLLQNCGYSIKQCEDKRKGWYIEKHSFEDWEIKMMLDVVQQNKFMSQKEVTELKEKLLTFTSKRGKSRFSHLINPNAPILNRGERVGEYIELMLEAMYVGKKVEFQYTELQDDFTPKVKKDGKYYKLNLYTIYWSGSNYYLIGSHDNHDGLTKYRLDRVINMRISEENCISPKDKIGDNPERIIQEYIDKSVLCFSGEEIRIEIEYQKSPVNNSILYDFTSGNIRIKEINNETCRATFYKSHSITLVGWFMQYANRFKVIHPESLRRQVIEELEKAIEQYKEG